MKVPEAEHYAKNLIKGNPDLFQNNARTIMLIGQTIIQYQRDCHEFLFQSQKLNVFNMPNMKADVDEITELFIDLDQYFHEQGGIDANYYYLVKRVRNRSGYTKQEEIELLKGLRDYFDRKADVKDQGSNQVPNEAMKFLSRIDEILPVSEQDKKEKWFDDAKNLIEEYGHEREQFEL